MANRRIPLDDFFRNPERVLVTLAPDGGAIAYLAPWKRRLNVFVEDLASGEVRRVTDATERDIAGYLWADDRRLVYTMDRGGDENFHLYAVGRDGSNPLDLTPFEGAKCSVVDELEDVEGEILFSMNRRVPEVFDVYHLDVNSGTMEMVAENPGNVGRWVPDHAGRLRVAVTTDGVNRSLLVRTTEADAWRTVATYDFRENVEPLLFTADDRALYVASNVGRDRRAIVEYDLESGREGELVFAHPEVDVSELLWSRLRRKVTGVAFERDRLEQVFFDGERRALQDFVDGRLPGRVNRLQAPSRDETRFVVASLSDSCPASYHLLDAEKGDLRPLFDSAPWFRPEEMAPVEPIRFRARDGLGIHGYLTRPVGSAPGPLPLIVHPHGGPWVRDSWVFDRTVQFLANRGYAVLQVNYRGSAGYGRAFLEAGFGQWGLAMQDDLTDAVQWAIGEGVADPRRVGIYGASYGGYAALSGLTKTPDLYACGVSFVGVSNLFTWIEAFPPYWKPFREMVYEMVGHPERDAERLRATSPFFCADRIRAPLLVAQGANDPRVRKAESDQIVAAMRGRGIEVDYIVREDEGHGFRKEENLIAFFREMEAFLDRHLGGR